MLGFYMFGMAMLLLFTGFPVAFVFGGCALLFGLLMDGPELFALMPFRIMNIMENTIMMAIPMFIFMGVVLQKSNLAEDLLESVGRLFGKMNGGLAYSTILVGALLAASTGVVGASVVAMGVISLPVMLKYRYSHKLATGVICASGTLGQIIPPSIILIILGDVMGVPVGDLFQAALIPGALLVFLYLLYVALFTNIFKNSAPPIPKEDLKEEQKSISYFLHLAWMILPPVILIILVLGSILAGIATPTESSAVGGIGALVLSAIRRRFSVKMLMDSAMESMKITAMVFLILIGATAFSMVFSYSGSDYILEDFLINLTGGYWGFLLLSMVVIFVLGFFIDFVEISFIIIPILYPIAEQLGIGLVWFAILVSINLQTSFLTPPFGFSLFYLKGVCPPGLKTGEIYKGVIPFIVIQIFVLGALLLFPSFFQFPQ